LFEKLPQAVLVDHVIAANEAYVEGVARLRLDGSGMPKRNHAPIGKHLLQNIALLILDGHRQIEFGQ
jgi:hypothetical protein